MNIERQGDHIKYQISTEISLNGVERTWRRVVMVLHCCFDTRSHVKVAMGCQISPHHCSDCNWDDQVFVEDHRILLSQSPITSVC